MSPQIHWEQGLFLQPHHLQHLQRSFSELNADVQTAAFPSPSGVQELVVDERKLAKGTVHITRLHAILSQTGTQVDFDERSNSRDNTELAPLDITSALKDWPEDGFEVSLALPLWSDRSPNIVSAKASRSQEDRLFYVKARTQVDENTGTNKRELKLRFLNARLVLDAEAREKGNLEILPLLRVLRASGNQPPRFDPRFVPPCLTLASSKILSDLVEGLVAKADEKRRGCVDELVRFGEMKWASLRGIEFEKVLRLRSLNAFVNRAAAWLNSSRTRPLDAFMDLSSLLGELAALQPQNDARLKCPIFQHEALYACFSKLAENLQYALQGAVVPEYFKIEFQRQASDPQAAALVLKAMLTEEQYSAESESEYYLGVKTTGAPAGSVVDAVTNPNSNQLYMRPGSRVLMPGPAVELREQRDAPGTVPSEEGLLYFRVLRSGDSAQVWQQIIMEKQAAIWLHRDFDERWPEATFALYVTRGQMI